jgi:hypothetical protein
MSLWRRAPARRTIFASTVGILGSGTETMDAIRLAPSCRT